MNKKSSIQSTNQTYGSFFVVDSFFVVFSFGKMEIFEYFCSMYNAILYANAE